MSPPHRKKKLLAALSSALLAFLSVEIGLRIAGYAPLEAALGGKGRVLRPSQDPLLGYELTPSTEGAGWGTHVEINSHGFRDSDYSKEKGERRRICVIGDSIPFGNHLEPQETYPELLETELRERGTRVPVDVLNLGVGGYDTVQEVAMLERTGLGFDPDLVVLGFCVNDLGIVSVTMDHSWAEEDRENPLYLSRIAQGMRAFLGERKRRHESSDWSSDEFYGRAFADQIADIEGDLELRELMAALRADLRIANQNPPDTAPLARRIPPRWFASAPRVGRFCFALDQLAALSEEHGFESVLLFIPYLDEEPAFQHADRIVRHLAEARGITVLAVRDEFRATGLEELRIDPKDPVHPDARGHAILARRLLEHTDTLGWFQPQ
ncbi:MAG: hypothetical protein CMJ89_12070 [Planctomycetes bacterium]|nr:hypothetical protein [Planctomycetota bacterium]